jgi:predicted ester cyclase
MTREIIEQLLARQQAAFARRDVDELTAAHAPEGTLESPAYGVVRGRDAIREVYRYWYRAFPDFLLAWEHAVIDPPYASYFWTFEGTAAGPFFGEVRPGTHVKMIGATENLFGDQGIVATRHVFDFSGTLVRLGVLKVKPS